MTEVRHAHASDLDRAADTVAVAFEDYPWTRHVLPEADYFSRLCALRRLYLGYAHEHGIIPVTDNCDGVIALLAPDTPDPEPEMITRAVSLHGDLIDRLGHAAPQVGVWRLETLGCDLMREAAVERRHCSISLSQKFPVGAEATSRSIPRTPETCGCMKGTASPLCRTAKVPAVHLYGS